MVGQQPAGVREARTTSPSPRRLDRARRRRRRSTGDRPRVRRHARARGRRPASIEIEMEAHEQGAHRRPGGRRHGDRAAALLTGLRAIDAPKTLIFVSEGFILGDNSSRIIELGALAAASRTSIYALKLDIADVRRHRRARAVSTRSPIARRRPRGSRLLAGASRGALFNVIGTGAACSSGSPRSCPATTCSASSRTAATRTASRTRSASR